MSRVVVTFASMLPFAVGCSPAIPHRVENRTVDLVASVSLEHLPPHARVVEENGAERHVIAAERNGAAVVTIPYRATEHVDNGEISSHRDAPAEKIVFVEARGYLPRRLVLHVPADRSLDARLERPALYWIDPDKGPRVDAVLIASMEGDCDAAAAGATAFAEGPKAAIDASLAACPARAARRRDDANTRDWDPAALGIPQDTAALPDKAVADLQLLADKESDATTKRAVAAVRALVMRGDLDEAARIAELVADSLPSKRSALTLELPAALFAEARVRSARTLLSRKDERAAMDQERRAYAIAPLVAAPTFPKFLRVRASELVKTGAAREAKNPLAARGFFLAAETTDASYADAGSAEHRTDAAAKNAAHVHLVVKSNDDASARSLASALAAVAPRHVTVDTDPANASAALFVAISSTQRSIKVTETHGTKSVVAFRVTKHNDAYDQAQEDVANAEQGLQDAQQEYEQAHANAQQLAAQAQNTGGLAGTIGAIGAGGEEGTGQALVIAAKTRLANARQKLKNTPTTIREDVKRDASYPVLHFEADAVRVMKAELAGFGDPIEVTESASAHVAQDQVIGDAKIGVASTPSPKPVIEALEPNVAPLFAAIAKDFANSIAAREESRAWSAVEDARKTGNAEAEAAASALYLEIAPDSPRRAAILQRLAEVLP